MPEAGYSGTPLAKKLGIKEGFVVSVGNEPDDFRDLLIGLPEGVTFQTGLDPTPNMVIDFHKSADDLITRLGPIGDAVFPDGIIWIAWPKKTSGVETDLTGDVVRSHVLATNLVDVKVCAISDIWSGLKIVWRKEHRK